MPGQAVAAAALGLRTARGPAKVVHLRGLAARRPAAEWPACYDAAIPDGAACRGSKNAQPQPTIAHTLAGLRLNWNCHCVDPAETTAHHALAQEFRQLLRQPTELSAAEVVVRRAPSEAVAWWSERVLHGRRAFQAAHLTGQVVLKSGFRLARDV
ncbi:MAG: hypothetical protein ACRYFK_05695 [Janthinobacterium lividum]